MSGVIHFRVRDSGGVSRSGGVVVVAFAAVACGNRNPRNATGDIGQFMGAGRKCAKCEASKTVAVRWKKYREEHSEQGFEPVDDPEEWKARDDALLVANRAARRGVKWVAR